MHGNYSSKKNILVFVFYCFAYTLKSQTLNFQNFSADEGLPFAQVYAICQDSNGYLWTGSYGGLSRFDGRKFENYNPKSGLVNHWVTSIAAQKNNTIWIGTIKGLSVFEGNKFKNYSKENGLIDNHITSIIIEKDGDVCIATTSGISQIKKDFKDSVLFKNITTNSGLPSNNIETMFEDNSGRLWVGTDKGLVIIEKEKISAVQFSDKSIKCIAQDKNGIVWIGTSTGIIKIDNYNITNYGTSEGLPDNEITTLVISPENVLFAGTQKGLATFEKEKFIPVPISRKSNSKNIGALLFDLEGNLWIGTFNGLYKYRESTFETFTEEDGLSNSFIYPIFRDKAKNLWVGTDGGGLFKMITAENGRTSFKNYTTADGLASNIVYGALSNDDGTMWLATSNGLSYYNGIFFVNFYKEDGLMENACNSLFRDSKGDIWIGQKEGITKLTLKHNIPKFTTYKIKNMGSNFDVWQMSEDNSGNLWLGTFLGGLFKFDRKKFTNYSKFPKFNADSYFVSQKDNSGNLYFSTLEGVYIFNPSNIESIDYINEKVGLSSNLVYTLRIDRQEKYLWIGTNQGINRFDLEEYKTTGKKIVKHFGREDGFLGGECNTGILEDEDGSIWISTVNGLVKYKPDNYRPNTVESKTNIIGIKLFFNDTILEQGVKLPYQLNNIAFDYVGVCLTNSSKVLYSYKLEGFDRDWSPSLKVTNIRYPNLPPGTYTFKVRSCNDEGIWNTNPASFSFTVLTPYYKTWWFWTVVTALTLISIFAGLRYRVAQIRMKAARELKQKTEMATVELKALRAQMNPHFVFNCLNSIQHFILNNDSDAASKYLNTFAKLIRKILHNSEETVVSIREEIDSLKLYLQLESLRFENQFDYTIEIDKKVDIDYFEIPSMLLQPYVENAILHGLIPKKEKGLLEIKISEENGLIKCTISDNGIGRKKALEKKDLSIKKDHKSLGSKITFDRIELLNNIHQTNMSVTITDLDDTKNNLTGTIVEIFIPI